MKTIQFKTTFLTALLAVGISMHSAHAGIPFLISATPNAAATGVTVTFSEALDGPSATTNLSYYAIDNGASVTGAVLGGTPDVVELTTTILPFGFSTLTVTGVVSSATGEEISPGSFIAFDQQHPTLAFAETRGNHNGLIVTFAGDLDGPSATTNLNYYQINNGVTVSGVTVGATPNVVELTTSAIAEGSAYSLTVTGVVSSATGLEIAAGATSTVFVQAQGVITRKVFRSLAPATALSGLTNNAKFPNNPDEVAYLTEFATPIANGEYFGDQVVGLLTPPVSGGYVFAINSDEYSALYLGTSANPASKVLICSDAGEQPALRWIDSGANQPLRGSPPINISATNNLVAGQQYYIEAVRYERILSDNLGVTWQVPGGNALANFQPPIPGRFLSTLATLGAVTIATNPVAKTVQNSRPVTFTVAANGTPPYTYQWYNGATPVGGNSSTYTIPHATLADNGTITVAVSNAFSGAVSTGALLTVTNDITKPTLLSATGGNTPYRAIVKFSEWVDPGTATTPGNYTISGGLTVSAATLAGDGSNVVLTTSSQIENSNYVVTVNNVQDLSLANTINAASTVNFTSWVFSPGFVQFDYFSNITGTAVADLTGDPRFPFNPENTRYLTVAEYVPTSAELASYGALMSGYFVPAVDGDHLFYISAYTSGELWFSPTDDAALANPIEFGTGISTQPRAWQTIGSTQSLLATNRYYMEARAKGGNTYPNNLGLTVQEPGSSAPATAQPPRLFGKLIGAYASPVGKSVTITNQPQNVTRGVGVEATFTVVAGSTPAGSPIFYQWQSNSVDIVGANSSSYTIPPPQLSNDGDQYRCQVVIPGYVTNSTQATLSVIVDTTPPTLVSTATLTNSLRVGVLFNEFILDTGSTVDPANYTVSGGATVVGVTLQTRGDMAGKAVALDLDVPIAGNTVTVTVNNVTDLSGNPIAANSSVIGPVINLINQNVGTAPGPAGSGVFTVKEGDYDCLVGGPNIGGANDQGFQFNYFEVTGDFDMRVQVTAFTPAFHPFATAGLMFRENLEPNSRYFTSLVLPWESTADQYMSFDRITTGGSPVVTLVNYATDEHPQWVRLKRSGSTVTEFYSNNGTDWGILLQRTLPVDWAATSYVGTEGSSRLGTALSFVQFRNFGPTPVPMVLSATPDGTGKVVVSWTGGGTLQQAGAVAGPYTNAPSQSNPQTNSPSAPALFYRLMQ